MSGDQVASRHPFQAVQNRYEYPSAIFFQSPFILSFSLKSHDTKKMFQLAFLLLDLMPREN